MQTTDPSNDAVAPADDVEALRGTAEEYGLEFLPSVADELLERAPPACTVTIYPQDPRIGSRGAHRIFHSLRSLPQTSQILVTALGTSIDNRFFVTGFNNFGGG